MKNEYGEVWLNLGCGIHLLKNFINVDCAFTLQDLQDKSPPFQNSEIDDGAEFVKADMRYLPFPNNYADYILSVYSIEHIPLADISLALAEWKRVLKPDGVIMVVTLDFDNLAREWLAAFVDKPFNKEHYDMVSAGMFGNQITDGEYHYAPFNVPALNHFMLEAGYPYWEIMRYPNGWDARIDIKGYPVPWGFKMTCGEVHVKGYKKVPPKEDRGGL